MPEKFKEKQEMGKPEKIDEPEQHEKSLDEIDLSEFVRAFGRYNQICHEINISKQDFFGFDGEHLTDTEEEKIINERKAIIKKLEHDLSNLYDIFEINKEDLSRIGLCIESKKPLEVDRDVRERLEELGAGEWLEIIEEVGIHLVSGKNFVNYLDSLTEKSLDKNRIKSLMIIAEGLTVQLGYEYDLSNPDDEKMIELISNLENTIDKYHQLAEQQGRKEIGNSVKELENYLRIAKAKYLREYLLAKREHLLKSEYGEYSNEWWLYSINFCREQCC